MTQKNYQKLRKENYDAAMAITSQLKKRKAISEREFAQIFSDSKGIRPYCHGAFNHLMETTKKFLEQHGVVTYNRINGLIIWVATQKCVRAKMENMFIEYQTVTNASIDKAIAWQKINDGMIEPKLEGEIIAYKILGLTGDVASAYTRQYAELKPYLEELNQQYIQSKNNQPGRMFGIIDLKHAILSPLRDMKAIKKV